MSGGTVANPRRWLFGPVPDLLLGCGLGYVAIFLLQIFDPALLRSWIPAGAAPLVILVSGTPHYGATLLRVYERAEDRRAYALFTVWATLAIAGLFFAGLASAWIGSVLLTVYLSWSPWHYSGQNYGVALMFLGRRGVEIAPRAKRAFHLSFFLSFVLTFLAQHGAKGGPGYAPFADGSDSIRFLSLGIPAPIATGAMLAAGLVYALAVLFAFGSLLRRSSLRDVAPAAVLTATQALWFAAPVLVRSFDLLPDAAPFAPQNAAYAFLWIAAGHSLQYLWVTSFYAARSPGATGRLRYLAKCLLAGAAVWNAPLLLFGSAGLGWSRSGTALTALVASVVNLHHFVLDGAIWKLRDGRVAQILIRARQAGAGGDPALTPTPARAIPALRTLVWAMGIVCVAFVLVRTYEREIGFSASLQRGDLGRAQLASERLARIGLDAPEVHVALARAALARKQPDVAAEQLRKSLALAPSVATWVDLGLVHERDGNYAEAERAYASALALAPENVDALHRHGVALLGLGRAEEARAVLERAVALAPDQKLIAQNLARARARTAPAPPAGPEGELPRPAASPSGTY
jgi:tetratricopeptide (TPR) repeat protein